MQRVKRLSEHMKECPEFHAVIVGVLREEIRFCEKTGQPNREDVVRIMRNKFIQKRKEPCVKTK